MKSTVIYFHVLVAMCLVMAGGCASGRASESEKAVSSMQDVQGQLVKARKQVDAVVAQLGQLEQGGDLQKSFKAFNDSVSDLKSTAAKASQRSQDMKEKRAEYLAKWQEEVKQIQNPDVKQSLEERRQKVRDDYDRLAGMADDVKTAYAPFNQDLGEVQKALAIDLTPGGVSSMKSAFAKTRADGDTLGKKIDILSAELGRVSGMMSPSVAQ